MIHWKPKLEFLEPILKWAGPFTRGPLFLGSDAREAESLYSAFEMRIRFWKGERTYGVAQFDSDKGGSECFDVRF